MTSFNQELIEEITAYYRKRFGIELCREEAEEYLDSLADLYRCFKESIRQGFGGDVSAAGDGGDVPEPFLSLFPNKDRQR